MKTRLQTTKIFLSVLAIFILSCGPVTDLIGTPADPDANPDQETTESQTAEQSGDIISSDNALDLVEIAAWGKGSGHNPTYSPDGELLAVSSSSGIYLYDSQTLQEEMHFAAENAYFVDIAFSPDGKTLSAVTHDYIQTYTMQQWDLTSGSEINSSSVDFNDYIVIDRIIGGLSPDGRMLALIFDDQTVKLWDVASGRELHSLNTYALELAFSPDGQTLATAETSGFATVTLWDVSSGSQIRTLKDSEYSYAISVAFLPDGRTLALGTTHVEDDFAPPYYGVTQWELVSGRELMRFYTPEVVGEDALDPAFSLTFSPNGETLAFGLRDTIQLRDTASGNEFLSVNADNLESLTFSPDGKTLVSSSSVGDDSIKLWDAATGDLVNTLKGDNAGGIAVFSPDSSTLAYAPDDNAVRLRSVTNGSEVRSLTTPDWVSSLAFSPDGKTLALGFFETLELWDVASGSRLRTLNGHTLGVLSVDFSPDGRTLASGSLDSTMKLWDVASGSELSTFSGEDYVLHVDFSPDGKTLAFASLDNAIRLWDVVSGSIVHTLSGHTTQIRSVAFSPDGKELISVSFDGNKLWDAASGQELRALSATLSYSTISPDGKALATGFEDGTVKVLDPASGDELFTLRAHTRLVNALAFSPDGSILASGSEDNTIKLWEMASGQELASYSLMNVGNLVFSPDGRLLLSASFKGMSLWGVQP